MQERVTRDPAWCDCTKCTVNKSNAKRQAAHLDANTRTADSDDTTKMKWRA